MSDLEEPALLTIDLAAIVANYRLLAAQAPTAELAPAVKADAYGLGMAKVAPALAAAGARRFFVAWLAEGIALRALLPDAVIHVLNGLEPGRAGPYRAHRLIPCLDSLEAIREWVEGGGGPAVLHLDTGISRLGMPPEEWAALAKEDGLRSRLELVLAMTHLACGDDAANPMNAAQRTAFLSAIDTLGLGGGRVPLSIAASSGIFLGPEYHLDLTRPGAALYGLPPLNGHANPMRQVVRLQAKILQVRRVDSHMTVGYGATHRTTRPSRLATVSAGYADGLFRALGNRGHAYLGPVRVPVVGRVSMDLLTLDVTDAPPELARRGATIDLIGPHHSVDDLAGEAGTIGYEMLTALGRRYPRRYLDAGTAR